MPLTPRQTAVLASVAALTARTGYPPTLRELARETGLCLATIRGHVDALCRKGELVRDEGTARSLRPPHKCA